MHADVTISIICHNQLAHAKRCLRSVIPELHGAKLFLTSNGNEEVREFFMSVYNSTPMVCVNVRGVNEGFIGPSNEAFDSCNTRYFVLLNDDAVVPENWLTKLKAPFDDPKMAITGARGGGCTLTNNFIGYKGPIVEFIEGSCMMVDVEKVRPLLPHGLFAPYVSWAYGEDADLSLRVRQRGYRIAHADLSIEHVRSATTKTIPGLGAIMQRNFIECSKRWADYFKTRKFPNELVP